MACKKRLTNLQSDLAKLEKAKDAQATKERKRLQDRINFLTAAINGIFQAHVRNPEAESVMVELAVTQLK
jgi:hypothetical protein